MNNKDIFKRAIKEEFSKENNYNTIMKRRSYNMKNGIFKYGFAMACLVLVILGMAMLNGKEKLKNDPIPNNPETITIEGKVWYSAYEMGVNQEKVPSSPIYGYAIRKDNESYKIVSLHNDGTNFDLVAISITESTKDHSSLLNNYKLSVVDGQLYFIRLGYYDESGPVNRTVSPYDIEVYHVNTSGEHPSLEAKLQVVKDGYGIVYHSPMVYDGYLYYLDQINGSIEALPLGNSTTKSNIVIDKPIFDYYIENDKLYATYGNASDSEHLYYIVDFDKKNEASYNLYTTITEEEYYNGKDQQKIWLDGYKLHYFEENRYLKLYSDNRLVELQGNPILGKSEDAEGNILLFDGKEIYNNTTNKRLLLLNVEKDKINFCLSERFNCEQYYTYDIKESKVVKTDQTFNYFLVIYTENNDTDYILTEKTSLTTFCPENNCNKSLGTVKVGDVDYNLSVNLTNINSYETRGSISLGIKTIDIREMDLIESSYIYSKIEGFEIYDKYFIIYLRTTGKKDPSNTAVFHGYSMQIYDRDFNKVIGLDGETCGDFKDLKISNNVLSYNTFATYPPDMYNASLNTNNYDVFNVNAQISIRDLLDGKYENSQDLSINYKCGTSQQQP